MDVARKIVILARETGLELELDDLYVESLVPEPLRAGHRGAISDALPAYDQVMRAALAAAKKAGQVLRYVGGWSARRHGPGQLARFNTDHAFAHISLTDNIVQFETAATAIIHSSCRAPAPVRMSLPRVSSPTCSGLVAWSETPDGGHAVTAALAAAPNSVWRTPLCAAWHPMAACSCRSRCRVRRRGF